VSWESVIAIHTNSGLYNDLLFVLLLEIVGCVVYDKYRIVMKGLEFVKQLKIILKLWEKLFCN